MNVPADRRYSETHEWHMLKGDMLTLGLTQFAVDQLTDITFIEMMEVGTTFEAGDAVGEVESVKTTSDVYCAAPGAVVEVNAALVADPSLLNSDPFGEGWLVRIKVSDASPLDALMDAAAYIEAHPE
ncbi:MAG: glycine cleavage system protein GcvH [Planctomycetes bacterium]|nr:glycine cleavage system protein GcvH [Planctomycetota bacterium]